MNPDYQCRECGNHVLYLRDHKPDCMYYVSPYFEWVTKN